MKKGFWEIEERFQGDCRQFSGRLKKGFRQIEEAFMKRFLGRECSTEKVLWRKVLWIKVFSERRFQREKVFRERRFQREKVFRERRF